MYVQDDDPNSGRFALSAGEDQKLVLWDLRDGKVLSALQTHAPVQDVFFRSGVDEVCILEGSRSVSLPDMRTHSVTLAAEEDGITIHCGYADNAVHRATRTGDDWSVMHAFCSNDEEKRSYGVSKSFTLSITIKARFFKERTCKIKGTDTAPYWTVSRDLKKTLCGTEVWNLDSGQKIVYAGLIHRGPVSAGVFSPDGRLVVTTDEQGPLKLWIADTGQVVAYFKGQTPEDARGITVIAFSPDGVRLVTGHADGRLRVWHRETRQVLVVAEGHAGPITCLAFCGFGQRLLSGSQDGTVRSWDLPAVERRPDPPPPPTASVTYGFKELRHWQSSDLGDVHFACFLADASQVMAASKDGDWRTKLSYHRRVWNSDTGQLVRTDDATIWDTARVLSRDGSLLLSFDDEGKHIRLHELRTGKSPWDRQSPGVTVAAFSADTQWLALGGKQNARGLELWNVASGEPAFTLASEGPLPWCSSLVFARDGGRLYSGHGKEPLPRIRVWDLLAKRSIEWPDPDAWEGHMNTINALAVTPDGTRLVSASDDNTVRVWDTHTGRELHCLGGHTDAVQFVAVTPDGRRAVSLGKDRTVRLWDIEWSQCLACVLTPHTAPILTMALSPNGQRLLTSAEDKTLRLWEITTDGQSLQPPSVAGFRLAEVFLQCVRSSNSTAGLVRLNNIKLGKKTGDFPQGPTLVPVDVARALQVARWALAANPRNAVAWFGVFLAYDFGASADRGETIQESIRALNQLLKAAPQFVDGWVCKGKFYRDVPMHDHLRLAKEAYWEALRLQKGHREAFAGMAELANRYGDLKLEQFCYEELANYYPQVERYRRAVEEIREQRKHFGDQRP